ncbi:MAG: InlB B-repeat-containing protein [Kiritimatiellae bacterium]|nr:InlB B-repeat-containing protein [Kiritimatiellia bacterium]
MFGTTKAYGLHDSSGLANTIISAGFTEVRDGTDCGAIYVQNHASRSDYAGSAVSWLSNATEPAATATVTYRQEFIVAFEDWDGTSLCETQTVYIGENATPPADPTRVGHRFSGWSDSYENVQSNLTLVAEYNPDMFTVRFLDWDGELLKSELVAYGTDATPPSNPTREGFRFFGWSAPYTGITEAVDITAVYVDASAVTHWVTFKDYDGTELSLQEVLDGGAATPPADPTREGWHFTGWSGTYTGVTQDVTITATYAINSYAIEFQDWDGTVLKTEEVEYGSSATPPVSPTRTGYHFVGWQGAYQNVSAAATVVAQYEINMYTVRFLHENGTVLSERQVAYQGAATAPANPAPLDENRVFYKWSCSYSSIVADTDVVAVFVNKLIEIATGAEFVEYMGTSLANRSDVTFALVADISLSGTTYKKPGTFSATLDGRGHTLRGFPSDKSIKSLCGTLKGTIRNLCIANYSAPASVGETPLIASSAQGATVSGVVLSNCTWKLPSASQGTAGFFYSTSGGQTTITNCSMVNCKITSTGNGHYIGGFVGNASNLLMVDCDFTVGNTDEVAVGNDIPIAGALVGKCGSGVTIRRCRNNARVKIIRSASGGAAVGGLVGGSWSNSGSPTIVDCANFGTVEATSNVPAGGIIGESGTTNNTFTLSVRGCFNYGSVSSPLAAGGIVGSFMGANNVLVNCGNSGSISSDAGFAGGIVGRIRYNGNARTAGFNNMMQAGTISTVSGYAGIMAGGLAASTGSDLTLVVSNSFLAGSAVATGGGKTGLAFGGRDTHSGNALAVLLGGSKVLVGNASLPLYYDGANSAVTWDSPAIFASTELINRQICEPLDGVAEEKEWMRWIQGREYPELALFGNAYTQGIAVIFY